MKILGIETSCDETAVAIIEATGGIKGPQFRILSNIISSQVKLHSKYGGVVPNLAKREHQKNLAPVLLEALEKASPTKSKVKNQKSKAQFKSQKFLHYILEREPELLKRFEKYILPLPVPKIDAIAVTVGPGLEPALWVGINFAKALAHLWEKPLIGVNHLEGHIYSNWLEPVRKITNYKLSPYGRSLEGRQITNKYKTRNIDFPAICLIVSGGHSELILMQSHGKYKLLGETRDDAAGEAFDKVARLLGLGFPGGPAIDAIASKSPITNYQLPIRLPRPMMHQKNYDFSFAGLKTAVLYKIKNEKRKAKSEKYIQAMAAEFQQAVVDVLIAKTLRAAKEHQVRTVMISGGVSANSGLRQTFNYYTTAKLTNYSVLFPPPTLTGDNAAMIAMAGYINYALGKRLVEIGSLVADANIRLGE
jgi:N6-L-threonylcarbamoyladenine synthase